MENNELGDALRRAERKREETKTKEKKTRNQNTPLPPPPPASRWPAAGRVARAPLLGHARLRIGVRRWGSRGGCSPRPSSPSDSDSEPGVTEEGGPRNSSSSWPTRRGWGRRKRVGKKGVPSVARGSI
eukprot:1195100-Prorocentrum_minimum.AAC.3